MGDKYTSVTITGYNSNPPVDDGTQTEANRLKWSTIKTKLDDPLKTAIEAINTNVATMDGKIDGGITSTAISYQVVSGDQGKLVRASASGIVITTPDATDVDAPFVFGFLNDSDGTITLDGSGSQTIDGAATATVPAGAGGRLRTDGTNWFTEGQNFSPSFTRGHKWGLTLSNNVADATNDIDIAAGECRSADNSADMVLASALTKRLDGSWVVGSGEGGLDTGSIGTGTYHVWLIKRTDTGVVDALFSLSATAPTMPANYDKKRRIGAIIRTGGVIKPFVQDNDEFSWVSPALDVDSTNPGTSASLQSLLVPVGIRVTAKVSYRLSNSAAGVSTSVVLSDPSISDVAPVGSLPPFPQSTQVATGSYSAAYDGGLILVKTDTLGRIRARLSASDADVRLRIGAIGWIDPLDRVA